MKEITFVNNEIETKTCLETLMLKLDNIQNQPFGQLILNLYIKGSSEGFEGKAQNQVQQKDETKPFLLILD